MFSNREEFIEYLKTTGLHFIEGNEIFGKDYDGIYIHGCEYWDVKKHPRKNKNLFVREVRVSHFDSDAWYVKETGLTYYTNMTNLYELIESLKEKQRSFEFV